MKILKAIGLGVVLWVLIFFEVSILMFGFKLNSPNIYYYIIHGILITIFILILSLIYFSGKNTKKGFAQGLALGFIWVVVSVILDSIITIPIFMLQQGGYALLIQPEILISELWTIVLCGIIGAIKKR